jgi:hypothetical protein
MTLKQFRKEQLPAAREILSAERTYYVRADGNDNNTGLEDTPGGSFLTFGRAVLACQQIDPFGYKLTIHLGPGTFDETVGLGYISGIVDVEGSLTELETISSATVSAGGAATQGAVTKTDAFSGNNYANKLAYFVTDDDYRIIDSHTVSTLTLVGQAPSSTTQDVVIYDWATTVSRINISAQHSTQVRFLRLQNTSNGLYVSSSDSITIKYCHLDCQVSIATSALTSLFACACVTTVGQAVVAYQGCTLLTYWTKIHTTGNFALTVFRNAFSQVRSGTILQAASYGIYATDGGRVVFYNADVRCRVRNCSTGLYAATGSQITSTNLVVYSGNTTNENAIAASYGYID